MSINNTVALKSKSIFKLDVFKYNTVQQNSDKTRKRWK